MNKNVLLLLFSLTVPGLAFGVCDNVESGYEDKDVMYVLCSVLAVKNDGEATKLIQNIMSQYKGPPDEIFVYFVKSKSSIGKEGLTDDEITGYYYTHSNELVIRSGVDSKVKTFNIKRN